MKIAVALLALLTLSSARYLDLGLEDFEMSSEHGRDLLDDEEQEATQFAELLGEALSVPPPAMSEEYLDPIIHQRCTTDSIPFYKTLNSAYIGCFAMCQFVDYCEVFTYNPGDAECCLFHDAEVQWNTQDSPYYCWGIERQPTHVTV